MEFSWEVKGVHVSCFNKASKEFKIIVFACLLCVFVFKFFMKKTYFNVEYVYRPAYCTLLKSVLLFYYNKTCQHSQKTILTRIQEKVVKD